MKAVLVGIKALDFKGEDGPVKMTKWFLNFPGDGVEGHEVGWITWDEMKRGKPPIFKPGEEVTVAYNKYGKLNLA